MPAPVLRHVRPRVLLAWSALVVVGGAVAVAVEPAPAATEVATAAADEAPTTSVTPRRPAATTTTVPPTTVVDPATTAAPTTAAAAPVTTEAPPAPVDTEPAPPPDTTPAVAAPLAPAAGRYPVAMSGSSSGSGHLVIDGLGGAQQRLTVPGGLGQLVLVVRYTEAGAELVSLDLSAGPVTKSFRPSSGAVLFAFGAPVGSSWSWSTTSTDGATHVAQSASVIDSGTATVGGVSVPVDVIRTTLTVSGDVNGTVVLTSSVAPQQKLLVGQRQVANVTAFGFPVSADTTMALQSLTPS